MSRVYLKSLSTKGLPSPLQVARKPAASSAVPLVRTRRRRSRVGVFALAVLFIAGGDALGQEKKADVKVEATSEKPDADGNQVVTITLDIQGRRFSLGLARRRRFWSGAAKTAVRSLHLNRIQVEIPQSALFRTGDDNVIISTLRGVNVSLTLLPSL